MWKDIFFCLIWTITFFAPIESNEKSSLDVGSLSSQIISSDFNEHACGVDQGCGKTMKPKCICPEILKPYPRDESCCYILYTETTFPFHCPYPNFLSFEEIKDILFTPEFRNHKIWLDAMRDISANRFNVEWIGNDPFYGQAIPKHRFRNPDDVDKNCVIWTGTQQFERVYCSDKYSTLCFYNFTRLQFSPLRENCEMLGFDKCILGHYNFTKPNCFCMKKDISQPKKIKMCDKLAEPVSYYQSYMLRKYFETSDDICWLGLYKDKNDLKWRFANASTDYSFWARPLECKFTEGAFKFNSDAYGGWVMKEDRTLKCALCDIDLELKALTLRLQYNRINHYVQLFVNDFNSLSKFERWNVYCFSTENSDDFKKPVGYDSVNKSSSTSVIINVTPVKNHPNYYWCEAFDYSSNEPIKSNIIVAYNEDIGYGYEFVVMVNKFVNPQRDVLLDRIHEKQCSDIWKYFNSTTNKVTLLNVRPMSVNYELNLTIITINCHLTTEKSNNSIEEWYEILEVELNNLLINVTVLSCEACFEEITYTSEGLDLIWPKTYIGSTAIPINRLCLDETRMMAPVIRECEGNFLSGAKWKNPVGTCYNNTIYPETTTALFNLLVNNESTEVIANNLLKITAKNENTQPIDVHLISSILERITGRSTKTSANKNDFSNIVNNIMLFNNSTLQNSQSQLNSTDRILNTLDNYFNAQEPWFFVLPKLIVHISDLKNTEVRGLALYRNGKVNNFYDYKIVQLYANASFERLIKDESLDVAVVFPNEKLITIRSNQSEYDLKLVILILFDDILFNEKSNNNSRQAYSKIISVTVPGYIKPLESPIKIAYRTPSRFNKSKFCSFWMYGLDERLVSKYGEWQIDQLSQTITENLEICEFRHTTHFGMLIEGDLVTDAHETILTVLTLIGSVLSLIGIIPIFLTAAVFKSWMYRTGNIILINFCIAITFQILLTFSSFAIYENNLFCKLMGVAFHYSVLSEFCWMFVVALLQHRRFVLVFMPQENNLIKKCLLVGWVVPLLPVIITVSVSLDNYQINQQGNFCFVSGNYLIYAYITPILIVLISNIFIFAAIIFSVSRQSASCSQRHRNYKLQILLAMFLFFVLGMTWIFGFLGVIWEAIWLTYVFCLTATLRGLVLFLFFIVGNDETRLMWKKKSKYYIDKSSIKVGSAIGHSSETFFSSE